MSNDGREYHKLEFTEASKHYIAVESRMHDVLKLFTTLTLALLAASLTFLQIYTGEESATSVIGGVYVKLAAVWTGFLVLTMLLLLYFIELRMRKILFVEQLAASRDWFKERVPALSEGMKLIRSVEEAPPYLRRPCAEWYAVIYIAVVNTVVLAFVLYVFSGEMIGGWLRIALTAIVPLLYFIYVFVSLTKYLHEKDIDRALEVGAWNYNLFDHSQVRLPFFKQLDWLATRVEARQEHSRFGQLLEEKLANEG